MRRLATLSLTLALAGCAGRTATTPSTATAPVARAPKVTVAITADELRRDLFAFAADSFLGRSAVTPNGVHAARFIADRLAALGIEPAGDSGFFQRVPLQRQSVGPATQFTVTTPAGSSVIAFGQGLVALPALGAGVPLPRLSAEGDLVFAGYGLTIPELRRDDLAGLDLSGKTVVFINDVPAGMDSARRLALMNPSALGQRLGTIARRGPAAIVVLFTEAMSGQISAMASELRDTSLSLGSGETSPTRPLPMLLFGVARGGSPFVPPGWPRDDRAQPLQGRRFSGRLDLTVSRIPAYNVVGVVRGSDASLNQSYLAFGAHLDHIGVQTPEHGDSIANGADDDGSGTVTLLALARAFSAAPTKPRRSVLFVWHTGEELGLYGSEWFTSHPTVSLDSVVAQLNADMIGRNAPDSLYLVGPAAAPNRQSSVLGGIVDSVNAKLPRPFLINREWDSPTHPEQIYYRSDHYNYAKHGVPIVFFTSGLHADYHKVTDEPAKIDYDKLSRVALLLHQSGLAVANRQSRPLPGGAGAPAATP